MARGWPHPCRGFADEAAPKVYDRPPRRGHSPLPSPFRDGYTNRAPRGWCFGRNGGSSSPSTASFITKVRLATFSSLWNYLSRSFHRKTFPIFYPLAFFFLFLFPLVLSLERSSKTQFPTRYTRLVILVVSLRIPAAFSLLFLLSLFSNVYLVVIVNMNEEKALFSEAECLRSSRSVSFHCKSPELSFVCLCPWSCD